MTTYVKISKKKYEAMKESIRVLSDKKTIRNINKSLKELKEGKFTTLEGMRSEVQNNNSRKR